MTYDPAATERYFDEFVVIERAKGLEAPDASASGAIAMGTHVIVAARKALRET